jgi:hypothetical protein
MRHRFYYFHPAPPGSPIPGSSVEVPYPRLTLSATFSKNEDAALVIAQLRRVRLSDGAVAGVAAVDSGGSPAAPGVQTVERTIVCPASCFDPGEFAYFVQVSLLKSSATADPRLTALRVTLGF